MPSNHRDKYFGNGLPSGREWDGDQDPYDSMFEQDDFMRGYGSDSFKPPYDGDIPLNSSDVEPDLYNAFGEHEEAEQEA